MALGTIFTLLVIPSIYVLLAKEHAGEDIGKLVVETPATESDSLEPAMAK